MDTLRIIKEAGYKVFCRKPLDKVNVSDILSEAGVSKQTFYRYFSDKYELADILFDDLFIHEFYNARQIAEKGNWEKVYKLQFDEFVRHRDFVTNVYSSHAVGAPADYDAHKCMELDKEIVRLKGGNIEDPNILLAIEMKDMGGIDYLRRWMRDGMKVSSEELAKMFYQVLPNILVPYFTV